MGSDIHLPAMPTIVRDLHTSDFMAQLVFIIFFVGAAFSRMIWGPISDIYGRRKVLFILLSIQIPSQFMCIIATNVWSLLFWRAFQSLGAGVISVIGTAIIADIFEEKERAKYYGYLELSFPIGFIIAPVLGAYLVDTFHTWRAGFIAVFIFLIITLIACYFIIPETRSKTEKSEPLRIKSYLKVICHREFFTFASVISAVIGVFILYVVNAPFIYMVNMGISTDEFAFFQLLPMIFNILGLFVYKSLLSKFSVKQITRLGLKLLTLVLPMYFGIAFGFFSESVYNYVLAVCIQSLIVPLFIPGLTSRCMDIFPDSKGLASSCLGGFRSFYQVTITIIISYYISASAQALFFVKGVVITFAIIGFFYVDRNARRKHKK
jgi:DHA1 family bicyclomycin/chloramphenicol resistance-like MFS transporter